MKPTFPTTVARVAFALVAALASVWPSRADYPSSLQSLGPIGYWRFNDNTVSPPLNVITNATSLGAIANGVCVGGPVKGQPGIIGNCVQFLNPGDPVGSINTKIDVPWNAALNPNPPFSIEFWANPTSLSADSTGYCPISNFDPNFSGGSRAGWLFYINSTGRWQFRLGNRGGYAGFITPSTGFAVPGVWQHIVVTWDGTNAIEYANGVVIGTSTIPFANWVNNPQSFIRLGGTPLTGANAEANYIAATSNNGNRGYDGYLEELAIYTNILSASTVAAHYAATNSGYDALVLSGHPAGYWPMHDAAVTPPTPPFPPVANLGSLGAAANGTNFWGALANQPSPGFAGFGTNSKSVYFDGDNGYCQITDTPGLHWATNDGITTNFITMAAWVKPIEQDFFRNIISHGWDVYTGDYAETFLRISHGVGGDLTGDGNYYEVGASDGVNFYDSVLVPIPPGDIGNWVFIVGTFDGSNWNLYRNGQLAGTIPANTGSSGGWNFDSGAVLDTGAVDVTNWWTIGSRGPDPFFVGQEMSFGGSMTEAAIFTNALAPSDVANLYQAAEVPPIITQAPLNPAAALGYEPKGSTVSFSVWADGTSTLTYMWLSNGIPTGVTTTNYSISNIGLGTYTIAVMVANAYGTNTPSVTFTVLNQPPFITGQPVPEQRYVGFPFTLSVTAGGSPPLTYYWLLGNTVVQSGASASYTATASLANGGNYKVIVSNATSVNVTSAPTAVATYAIPPNYPGVVIADGPIAYYRLDETNGSTTAYDRTGGHNGTYFNAALGVPGYSVIDPDTAAIFSGSNSYVGNIDGSAAAGINLTGHTNFTLEAWVNAPAGQNDQATIIAKGIGNNGTTETEQFGLDVLSGTYRFYVFHGGSGAGNGVHAATASDGPDGTWQHIVGVYDDLNTTGQGTNMYIYINGVLEGTGTILANGLNTTATPVSIGSKRTGNDPNYDGTFDGTIDEVAVYNLALTANQVSNHYASAYGSTLAPFITVQPVPTTNYAGLSVTLSMDAAGSFPLSFQWKKNGGAIGGATDHSLTISPVGYSDAGNYSVTVQNNVGSTNTVTVPLVVLAPPTNLPVINGLVMHLTFDNTLEDATGRGNDGTGKYVYIPNANTNNSAASNIFLAVTNTVAVDTNGGSVNPLFFYKSDGALGQALHFESAAALCNGGASVGTNDYFVNLGVRPDLQFGANDFTVSFWIRTQTGEDAGDLPFFTDTLTSTFGNGYVFASAYGYGTATPGGTPADPGGWAASIFGNGAGLGVYGDGHTIDDGSWHHLVYVADRTSGHLIVYLDGAVAHDTRTGGTVLNAAGDIDNGNAAVVGQDPSGLYGESGSYDIDDLGVWKRALAPLEAATIYIAGVSNLTSFTAPVTLTLTSISGNKVQLSWPSGTLQSAPNVTGPYTSLTNTSPYTNIITGSKEFFRVKQ